jgi:stage IV sporulation protein B
MRIFSMRFYKNLVVVYLCLVFCFGYATLLGAIPDHIYVSEGEELQLHVRVPVSFSGVENAGTDRENEESVSAVSDAWPQQENKVLTDVSSLTETDISNLEQERTSDYIVTCKFMGVIPIKEVEVSVISPQSVYACGRVIGIYGQTSGVLAIKTEAVTAADGSLVSPSENRVLPGDYISAVNGNAVSTKEELIREVEQNGENRITLTLERKGETIRVAVNPVKTSEGKYLLGIWVKDDMAGIGTMTYYTSSGRFGALGHGIGDGQTGELLSISSGSIYKMRLLGIQKGQTGTPGELEGVIYYGNENYLGEVEENDEMGIYGSLEEICLQSFQATDECLEIGYKQEIETDKAFILSDISGEVKSYEIVIDSVNYQAVDTNKGIHFHVVDSELLELTGGIVQGMSGSPIIQNGKLIGAVTHVLVNDPAKGYGIFIENMLGQ